MFNKHIQVQHMSSIYKYINVSWLEWCFSHLQKDTKRPSISVSFYQTLVGIVAMLVVCLWWKKFWDKKSLRVPFPSPNQKKSSVINLDAWKK